jgi:hypothetical protein
MISMVVPPRFQKCLLRPPPVAAVSLVWGDRSATVDQLRPLYRLLSKQLDVRSLANVELPVRVHTHQLPWQSQSCWSGGPCV